LQGFGAFKGASIRAGHEQDAAAGSAGGWHISLTLALSRREKASKHGFFQQKKKSRGKLSRGEGG
jgi:hypothetical protein